MQMWERAAEARIAILSTRLRQIDITRQQLIQQLSLLNVEFSAKKTECNSLHNSLAPISSLPNEILATIFQLACRHSSFEIVVSHVTRRWREVALSTPTLWTRIHRAKYAEDPEAFEKAAAYLLRTQRVPIQLVIEVGSLDPSDRPGAGHRCIPDDQWGRDDKFIREHEETPDKVGVFCQFIQPYMKRCNRLVIEASGHWEGELALEYLFPEPLPILSSIRIHFTKWMMDYSEPREFGPGGPSLTHLYLSGQPNMYYYPPLGTVTTLRLELDDHSRQQPESALLTNSLTSMPLLTHLELDHAIHFPPTPLTLPVLCTLSCPIKDFATDDAAGFLLALNAPLLEEMRVGLKHEIGKTLALRGSSKFPSLIRLYLTGDSPSTSVSSIRKLSEAFPFLVSITYTRHTGEFLASVQHLHDNDIGVWPCLESLGIKTWADDEEEFPETELQDLLSRRFEIGCPVWQLLLPKADIPDGEALISYLQLPITIAELLEPVSPFPDDSLERDAKITELVKAVSPASDGSDAEIAWSSSPSY